MGAFFENRQKSTDFICKSTGYAWEHFRGIWLEPREEDVIYDNPYLQRSTKARQGCQIDYLIHTKYKNLYLFEIKFSRQPITNKVITQVKEKVARLTLPRGTAILPVLVHVNGVSNGVLDSDYFYSIIDFGDLLTT